MIRRAVALLTAVALAAILTGCFGGGGGTTTTGPTGATGATGPQQTVGPDVGCPPGVQTKFGQVCSQDIPPPPPSTGLAPEQGEAPKNIQPGDMFKGAPQTIQKDPSNGNLSSSDLSPATGCANGLANSAAAAWNHVAVVVHEHTGYWLQSNGSASCYRTYAQQVELRNYWCNAGACSNAAVPGTSNHGWGLAVDAPPTTVAYIHQYAGGLFGQGYGSCSDAPWESWHVKYCGGYSGSNPGAYGSGGGGGGGSPAPCPSHPTLKRGSHCHGAVKHAQNRLGVWQRGLLQPKPDGDFGAKTKKSVKQFQRIHGLSHDGVIGKKTWSKLENPRYTKADEQAHINNIKLAWSLGHSGSGLRDKRRWCGRRAHQLVNVAEHYGWGNHRLIRVHALQAVDLRKGT